MKTMWSYFCRKERIDRKVGIVRFYALCALCVLCCFIFPLGAEQVADLSRDGVGITIDAEPRAVDLARDFYVTVTLSTPSGVTAELPDLRDRFQGFRVAENFAEKPITDKDGRTTTVSRWRLEPDPLARRYRLAPFAVQSGNGSFATTPVLFDSPATREAATGEIEVDPTRDLPPFSWKLVGICLGILLAAAGVICLVWLVVRKIRTMVRIHRMSPIERAMYELEALLKKGLPGRGFFKDFYVELTMVVRRYIERRHSVRAPNLTTEEFLAAAKDNPAFTPEAVAELKSFLESADMVKFAGVDATPAMADSATDKAKDYLRTDSAQPESSSAAKKGGVA